MKITKELKEVIERQINAQKRTEANAENEARRLYAEEVNAALANSKEFSALRAAAEAWENLVEKVYKESGFKLARRCIGYHSNDSWNLSQFVKEPIAKPFQCNLVNLDDKYNTIRDTVVLKLSYGKDFDEATEILKTYGIELE